MGTPLSDRILKIVSFPCECARPPLFTPKNAVLLLWFISPAVVFCISVLDFPDVFDELFSVFTCFFVLTIFETIAGALLFCPTSNLGLFTTKARKVGGGYFVDETLKNKTITLPSCTAQKSCCHAIVSIVMCWKVDLFVNRGLQDYERSTSEPGVLKLESFESFPTKCCHFYSTTS